MPSQQQIYHDGVISTEWYMARGGAGQSDISSDISPLVVVNLNSRPCKSSNTCPPGAVASISPTEMFFYNVNFALFGCHVWFYMLCLKINIIPIPPIPSARSKKKCLFHFCSCSILFAQYNNSSNTLNQIKKGGFLSLPPLLDLVLHSIASLPLPA